MSLDQPRQPAGTPIGGRFATAARTEPALRLVADLETVTAGAAALLGHDPDGGPDAMAALAASQTVLRAAESHLASRLGGLPRQRAPHQHESWQVRDDGTGPYCAACGDTVEPARPVPPVPARVAEHTITREVNLEDTVRAARRDSVMLDRPQTIDHPVGTTWKRTTVYPNGERTEVATVPPYTRSLDYVTTVVRPEELAAAARVVMNHPDRDPRTVAAMAASEVTRQFRPHVESTFAQVLTQHLDGRAGVNRDLLARIPDGTPGLRELRAHNTAEMAARAATAARFAGRLGA